MRIVIRVFRAGAFTTGARLPVAKSYCAFMALPRLLRRCLTSRYEARPFAAPSVDDNEHISACVLADGYVTFLVPFIISSGGGLLIVQDGGCVGKVDAMPLEVRGCLPRVPVGTVNHQSHLCTVVHIFNNVRSMDLPCFAREQHRRGSKPSRLVGTNLD